ncbi:MAG: S-layer homology domain-containing protein [Clostridia bacterium]|nr:S-layer homology domain-containing protein [Clostridia bacterium]
MKDKVLYSADVSDKLNTKTVAVNGETGTGTVVKSVLEEEQYVTIPASVFRFCGYDAIVLTLTNPDGSLIAQSDQKLVNMNAPMNLELNGGKALDLSVGETVTAKLSYDTTAFVNNGKTVYVTGDPNVAEVDEKGNVIAVGEGTTTLTATALPSGKSETITVSVDKGAGPADCPKDDTCPMKKFTDVDMNEWYHDGIHWALDEGVMVGTSAVTFSPDEATTRAMLVTMLWRLEGEPEPAKAGTTFGDVKAGDWYEKAVGWALDTGITSGTSATTFSPDDELTREQLATFLCRYAEYSGIGVSAAADVSGYKDAGKISDWALPAVKWAVAVGIINGTSQTTLSPMKSATRCEVATMLMRFKTGVAGK